MRSWIRRVAPLLMATGLVAAACGGTAPLSSSDEGPTPHESDPTPSGTGTSTIVVTPPGDLTGAATPAPSLSPTPTTRPTPMVVAKTVSEGGVKAIDTDQVREEMRRVQFYVEDWATDFRFRTVAYDELRGGGPPRDGIPAIDDPQFESVQSANDWLADLEPVQVVSINGDHRAYPVQIMIWHELVNDVVGGEPVVVTY